MLLLAGHAVSRLGGVLIMARMPYARDTADSRSKPLVQHISTTSVAIAAVTAASSLVPLRLVGVVGGVVVLIAAFGWGRYLEHRLGGYTGDCLGAAQQFGECAFYLACTAVY